jgi:hypothetical protein
MDIHNDDPLTPEKLRNLFPQLDVKSASVTSNIDPFYNCFAWAAGDSKNNWRPTKSPFSVWFTDSIVDTLDNFVENYRYVGFEETATSDYEDGFEKIAIYVDQNGEPTHAARQLDSGVWTSKLGEIEDIEHKTLQCLEGQEYGNVKAILKRPKGDQKQWIEKAIQTSQKSSKSSKN